MSLINSMAFFIKEKEEKMLCKECTMNHDFSVALSVEIDKVAALADLITGREKRFELSSEGLCGVGAILSDVELNLRELYKSLYEKGG